MTASFSCSDCSSLGHWQLFELASVPFCHMPISVGFVGFVCLFVLTLPFWHCKKLQTHLLVSCPCPRISHFSKEPWFFYSPGVLETKIGGWVCLLILGCHCSSAFSAETAKKRNICRKLTRIDT